MIFFFRRVTEEPGVAGLSRGPGNFRIQLIHLDKERSDGTRRPEHILTGTGALTPLPIAV